MTADLSNKKVITAALTGAIHTPSMSPHLPITPEQLIDEAGAAHAARMVRIAHELDNEPATPDEARQILGLKGLDKVSF